MIVHLVTTRSVPCLIKACLGPLRVSMYSRDVNGVGFDEVQRNLLVGLLWILTVFHLLVRLPHSHKQFFVASQRVHLCQPGQRAADCAVDGFVHCRRGAFVSMRRCCVAAHGLSTMACFDRPVWLCVFASWQREPSPWDISSLHRIVRHVQQQVPCHSGETTMKLHVIHCCQQALC